MQYSDEVVENGAWLVAAVSDLYPDPVPKFITQFQIRVIGTRFCDVHPCYLVPRCQVSRC